MNNIQLNEKDKQVLVQALDLYSRLLLGQIEELSKLYRYGLMGTEINQKYLKYIDYELKYLKSHFWPDLGPSESVGILSSNAPQTAIHAVYLKSLIQDDKDMMEILAPKINK